MIPALGAGGPGFKSRFGPDILLARCKSVERKKKIKTSRGHSELNQGPAGLQPDALPLSYIPCLSSERAKPSKHLHCEGRHITSLPLERKEKGLSGMGFEPMPSNEDQNSHDHSLPGSKD